MSRIAYDTTQMDLETKRQILERAKEMSFKWWTDELDCTKSFRRQPVDLSWQEIVEKLDQSAHFTIIHRVGVERLLEVGFSTLKGSPSYFLWIQIDEDLLDAFVEEFDLRVRN